MQSISSTVKEGQQTDVRDLEKRVTELEALNRELVDLSYATLTSIVGIKLAFSRALSLFSGNPDRNQELAEPAGKHLASLHQGLSSGQLGDREALQKMKDTLDMFGDILEKHRVRSVLPPVLQRKDD